MKLAFSIAKRFLLSGKTQTLMIILGIAIGVSVQVFIGSLITGLQKSLVEKTIGSASQITVKPSESGIFISDYENKIALIEGASLSITIVTPSINQNGAFVYNSVSEPVLVRGFNFTEANSIYGFNDKLIEGVLPTLDNEIALGSFLKETLGLQLGDIVEFQVPLIGSFNLTVVGFFDFNVKAINQTWAISTISTLQNILSIGDKVGQIEMQITDVFTADQLSLDITTTLNDSSLEVDNWIIQNAELLSGLQGQSISSLMIQVFVMISVVLAIASVLAITVLQKSKQIGILKAMGIKDKDASLVFLFEGLILGIFGALAGVLLGLGLAYSFTTFAIGADGNPVVPLYIDFGFIVLSALIAVFAATVASLIPARKSSKLSVIEVIRNA
ncbi:MAG: FtsX-like permease family protein [Candidatus Izemoplasmatales bacterium]|nr:FtsX-like permease family protein [Candidatus Izemoplasmatales bacterium]